jgi:hypothetical protein
MPPPRVESLMPDVEEPPVNGLSQLRCGILAGVGRRTAPTIRNDQRRTGWVSSGCCPTRPRPERRLPEQEEDARERDLARLVEQLRQGRCLPFIGAGACSGILPSARDLAQHWAQRCEYPFPDRDNLARVIQYDVVTEGDAVTVKERVVDYLRERLHNRLPDFGDRSRPHAFLAALPIPLYITTNYDNVLELALDAAERPPTTAICHWAREGNGWGVGKPIERLDPRSEKPVVFHLHGAATRAASLVLSEEDYLEFLINLADDKGADDQRIIPKPIAEALADRPMLFIGYSLEDWTFRVLFQGLKRTIAPTVNRRHLSIQLRIENNDARTRRRAEEYLKKQLDKWNITIYWGTAEEFCTELGDRLWGAAG